MYVFMYFLLLGITFTGPHYIIMVEWLLLASFPGFPLAFISHAVEKSRESLRDFLTCPTNYDVTLTPFDRNVATCPTTVV